MKDGNKESIKELLGAFRIIGSADLSIILALATVKARSQITFPECAYLFSMISLGLSLIGCIYLFLLAIRRISAEDEEIIEAIDIKTTAGVSLLLFAIGVLVVLTGLMLG